MPGTAAPVPEEASNNSTVSAVAGSSHGLFKDPEYQTSQNATEMNNFKEMNSGPSLGAAVTSADQEPVVTSTEQAMESAAS